MIFISDKISQQIKDLRKTCYDKYDYSGVDGIDFNWRPDKYKVYHISYYDNEKLLACCRIVTGELPFQEYFSEKLSEGSFEIGRLCVELSFNIIKNFQILSELVKKIIAVCKVLNCQHLYTSATHVSSLTYNKLLGFETIEGPEIYPPVTKKEIYLMKLDFEKEYEAKKRKQFIIDAQYLNETILEMKQL